MLEWKGSRDRCARGGSADTVTVTIVRNGQRQDVSVTLGERPPSNGTPTTAAP
jgi:S1-C subfamily serine protease